jgi:NADPH2 dehydrogenase
MTLLDPVSLGGLTIRNRIMMSPMSQRAAGEDACAGDWHLVHYGSRAVGGCGLVMVEDTAVTPSARTSHSALGLYDRSQAQALGRLVAFCRAQGAAVGLQLAHAGRKALADTRGSEGTISASPVAFGPGWVTPREATPADLTGVAREFAAAARLALEADFDVIEIHAAHGYLLHQFLSALTNFRDDSYGGDGEGRRRLLLEVVRAVRAQWPAARPLFVRLPAGDGEAGGLEVAEMVECARACAAAGADLIDAAGGTPLLDGRRVADGEVLAFATALAQRSKLAVAVGGGIADGTDAEELVRDRGASLVSVGRPLLTDPYWPVRAARDLGVVSPLPSSYARAVRATREGRPVASDGAVFSPDHPKHVDGSTGGERK